MKRNYLNYYLEIEPLFALLLASTNLFAPGTTRDFIKL